MIFRFVRNAVLNIVADFSDRIANGLILIMISKFLSVSEYGSYTLATTYLSFGLLLSLWGYGNLLTREVSKEPGQFGKYFVNFSIMRVIFGIVAFFVFISIAIFLRYTTDTFVVIVVVFLGIFAESIKNLIYSAFNAFEQTYTISIVFFSTSIIKLILSYLLLKSHYGIYELAWVNTITSYISAIVSFWLMLKKLPRIEIRVDWQFGLSQTKLAISLFFIALFSMAESRLDVVLLSAYFPEKVVGLYSAALFLQSGLLVIPNGIRNAVYPIFSKNSTEKPINISKIYNFLFKYLTLANILITVFCIFLAREIIFTIYDESFLGSIQLLQILMLSYPFYSIVAFNIRVLNAYNKDSTIARFFAIDMIITILLSLVIMPVYGGLGAAYLKVFTTGLLYILFVIQIRNLIPETKILHILLRGMIAGIVMIIVILLLNQFDKLFRLFGGIMAYFIALLFLGTFGKDEISLVKLISIRKKKSELAVK